MRIINTSAFINVLCILCTFCLSPFVYPSAQISHSQIEAKRGSADVMRLWFFFSDYKWSLSLDREKHSLSSSQSHPLLLCLLLCLRSHASFKLSAPPLLPIPSPLICLTARSREELHSVPLQAVKQEKEGTVCQSGLRQTLILKDRGGGRWLQGSFQWASPLCWEL